MEYNNFYEWVQLFAYKNLQGNSQPFVLVETAREYKEVCFSQYQWSFRSGLRYCFALISTVGYGDYIPQTQAGKIFTFFYMIIGEFPLKSQLISYLYFLGIPAFLLATALSAMTLRSYLHQDNLFYSFGFFLLLGFIILVILPSLLTSYIYTGSKTILDEIYFRIISITTVGFGDIVPFNSPPKRFSSTNHDENQACFQYKGLWLKLNWQSSNWTPNKSDCSFQTLFLF